jgi:hypothetical protein
VAATGTLGPLPRSMFLLSSPRQRRMCTAVRCSRRCRTPFLLEGDRTEKHECVTK